MPRTLRGKRADSKDRLKYILTELLIYLKSIIVYFLLWLSDFFLLHCYA